MTDNIVKFPSINTKFDVAEALEAAKYCDFEQVVIIGKLKEDKGDTILVTAEHQDKFLYLEMAELLRVMYLHAKGFLPK